MAGSRIATVSCTAGATLTGTAGGPLGALRASLARVSALKYAARPPAAMTKATPPAISSLRRALVMGALQLSFGNALGGKQLRERLAAAHQMRLAALLQHFRRARPGIVVG